MTGADTMANTPDAPPVGRFTRTLMRWLMRTARVAKIDEISPHFKLVELEGEALKTGAWLVGQKIQVAIGSGMTARTYTPMSWDAEQGRTRILAFMHRADSPGTRWASAVREGDACQFAGPRSPLDLGDPAEPLVLFGDETAFGLAVAIRDAPRGGGIAYLFEVSDAAESASVLEAIGIHQAILITRTADDEHLTAVQAEVARLAGTGARFVLTGKASSIQRVKQTLKAFGVGSSRAVAKAYWAPGKVGLD